jgi:ABC-type proline/glycine betaine transport system permease subunit
MFKKAKGWLVAFALSMVAIAGPAFAAAGDLGETVVTELSGGKAQILLVGGAVLILSAVVLLIKMIRKST